MAAQDVAGLFWVNRTFLRHGLRDKTRGKRTPVAAPEASNTTCADSMLAAASPLAGPPTKARAARGGIDVTLYDFERSWRRYLPVLQSIMGPAFQLFFEPCDARRGLSDDLNRRLREQAESIDLFVFSYVANETAAGASACNWCGNSLV